MNNTISRSLNWGYKVPDPIGTEVYRANPRPFDGFGVVSGSPVVWEAKHRKGLGVLDLGKIADHQIDNLLAYKAACPSAHVLIIWGVSVARGDNRIYIFNDMKDIYYRRKDKKNILLKELNDLPYLKVRLSAIAELAEYLETKKSPRESPGA